MSLAYLLHSRQKQANEDGYDGYHYEKFDQGKSRSTPITYGCIRVHLVISFWTRGLNLPARAFIQEREK
jgi:hypothetical protein